MSTKGASNRYGNSNGSKHQGMPTKHINYAWTKGFSKGGLEQHYIDHGKEFGAISKVDYAMKAVHFANTVDRQHHKSVIDYKGTTYKYDPRDGRLAIITKDGYVVSYHHTGKGFWYYPKKGERVWIEIQNN